MLGVKGKDDIEGEWGGSYTWLRYERELGWEEVSEDRDGSTD